MRGLLAHVLLAIAVLFGCAANALATPSPYPAPQPVPTAYDSAIDLGPAGTMLEADYFRTSQPSQGVSRIFPCRLHLRTAERTHRIVQACE